MKHRICLALAILPLAASLVNVVPPSQDNNEPPKYFTNSIGMRFAWIPPGSFIMGSVDPKVERKKQDKGWTCTEALHKVTLTKGFHMGVSAVTQEQWQVVMRKNPSFFKGRKTLPVENVSWNACQEFIRILLEIDKKPYRLPTESEWEYACRAGTKTEFYFGDTIATDQANFNGNLVHGNGKKGVYREQRGGSWYMGPENCRSARRGGGDPRDGQNRNGFRLGFFPD